MNEIWNNPESLLSIREYMINPAPIMSVSESSDAKYERFAVQFTNEIPNIQSNPISPSKEFDIWDWYWDADVNLSLKWNQLRPF